MRKTDRYRGGITSRKKLIPFSSLSLLLFSRKSATKFLVKYKSRSQAKVTKELSKAKYEMWCKGLNVIDARRRAKIDTSTKVVTDTSTPAIKREESQTYCQSVPWSAVFFGIALSPQACLGSATVPAKTSGSWLVAPASFKSDGAPYGKGKKYSTFNEPNEIYTLKGSTTPEGSETKSLADLIVATAARTEDCLLALASRDRCDKERLLKPTEYLENKKKDLRKQLEKANNVFLGKGSKYYYCGRYPLSDEQDPSNTKSSLCAVPWYVVHVFVHFTGVVNTHTHFTEIPIHQFFIILAGIFSNMATPP
jgi:hypothetical protein